MAPQWKEGMKPDLWTVNDGKELCQVLIEDTQFGKKFSNRWSQTVLKGCR